MPARRRRQSPAPDASNRAPSPQGPTTTDYRAYLSKRFPYLEKAIDDKVGASEDFRSLCRDYVDAVEALNRWEDSAPAPTMKSRIAEYRHLVNNLEAEILLELYRSATV
jgi:hypothetical protein